jgi:hypothetical protein
MEPPISASSHCSTRLLGLCLSCEYHRRYVCVFVYICVFVCVCAIIYLCVCVCVCLCICVYGFTPDVQCPNNIIFCIVHRSWNLYSYVLFLLSLGGAAFLRDSTAVDQLAGNARAPECVQHWKGIHDAYRSMEVPVSQPQGCLCCLGMCVCLCNVRLYACMYVCKMHVCIYACLHFHQ